MKRIRKTIKVVLHFDESGQVAIGVLEQEWNGAHRVDRRMAAARPLPQPAPPAPRGVPESLWMAWWALDARLRAWEDETLQSQR